MEREAEAGWEVTEPAGGVRAPGVDMAGFRDRQGTGLDMRVLPQPVVTVVIGFEDAMLTVDGTAGRQRLGSLVAALFPGPTRIRSERVDCLELHLSPMVAPAVLGASPVELTGVVADLEDVWGRQAVRLREQLAATAAGPQRFALMDEFLARRCAKSPSIDPEVAASWEHILAHRGRTRVGDLAASCGWSRKRLWSRFHAQLGLTPKRAAMLVRFDHAARRLLAGKDVTETAIACGYADQSHLHRDVLAFAGCTPGALTDSPEGKPQ